GLWPTYRGGRRSVGSFFAGWLTTELALHHIAWQVVFAIGFAWAGALAAWPGWGGFGVTLLSWAGLVRGFLVARTGEDGVEAALVDGLGADYRRHIAPELLGRLGDGIDWRQLLVPIPVRRPEVQRVRNLVYAQHGGMALRCDVYHHRHKPAGAPVLLQ